MSSSVVNLSKIIFEDPITESQVKRAVNTELFGSDVSYMTAVATRPDVVTNEQTPQLVILESLPGKLRTGIMKDKICTYFKLLAKMDYDNEYEEEDSLSGYENFTNANFKVESVALDLSSFPALAAKGFITKKLCGFQQIAQMEAFENAGTFADTERKIASAIEEGLKVDFNSKKMAELQGKRNQISFGLKITPKKPKNNDDDDDFYLLNNQ